ncbi:MAG: diguanylate cyclase [Selenomonadaceae bacterium]|nr:diguanylate cyclase [Selenomonadaceae bacterium]
MSKILIVDDEPVMLMLAKRMLAPHYEVVAVSSGMEAIQAFTREKPDLVLSDLLMPHMDGYELHRVLQDISAEPVPIIFMTADERDESESKGFAIGASDYIRKPLKQEILLQRVANILKNNDKMLGLKVDATQDNMTGLLNKATAEKEIGIMAALEPGAFLLVDLDSFKLVNDIYGHHMGDRILIRFAQLLKGMIRSTDLAGRIGGDEFVVYLKGEPSPAVLQQRCQYLNRELLQSAKEYMGDDMEIPLGASIGVAYAPTAGKDFVTLSKKADEALYRVKQHGKHDVAVYDSSQTPADNVVKNGEPNSASTLQMILGERNQRPGAYVVDFPLFRGIYRLLLRLAIHCRQEMQCLQFNLQALSPGNEEILTATFQEFAASKLRPSDCLTQNGTTRLLVLMPLTTQNEASRLCEDILSQWQEQPAAPELKIESKWEAMG